MSIEEELKNCDLGFIIKKMALYVQGRIKTLGIKNLEGKEPLDFVADVLAKVAEGKRDWGKANCDFELFLWGCLRSDLNGFFKKNYQVYKSKMPDIADNENSYSIREKKAEVIHLLKQQGANDDEIMVFDCWLDGLLKPKDIAIDLGIEVKQINNITKRIKKYLPKIQSLSEDFI